MNKKNKMLITNKRAYSLLELSIVILIISILITGAMTMSVGTINNAKNDTSIDRINQVYQAIGNYLLSNKRLPCPASLKKNKNTDSDYGVEVANCSGIGLYQSNTNSNLVYGAVPSKSLGLANDMAEDAYESKLIYLIDKRFAIASQTVLNIANTTFSTATNTGIITINEKPSGVVQTATNDAILVIISLGANKSSAFNSTANIQNTRSTDVDEMENDISSIFDSNPSTANFNNIIIANAENSENFDDLVFYKTRNQIVVDFNAMFLIPCVNAGANFSTQNAYYGNLVYATTSCATPNEDKRLTKKCEAFGNWVDIVANCP
jgi:prepilin-type N-terminal cleavage/methylation domain-containing protein